MKIIKVCEANNRTACFPDKINASDGEPIDVADADFIGEAEEWDTGLMGIVLQNGTSAIIKYNPNCHSKGITATVDDLEHCVTIAYDTNGKSHPNALNKDVQGQQLSSGTIKMIDMGDFKMTETAISYSPIDGNYWVGAADTCAKLGMDLPNGYNEYSNTPGGYCDQRTVGGFENPPADSQACKISEWCKTSETACTDSGKAYWLAQVNSYKTGSCYMVPSLGYITCNTSTIRIGTNMSLTVRCVKN